MTTDTEATIRALRDRIGGFLLEQNDHEERAEGGATADTLAAALIEELLPGPGILGRALAALPPGLLEQLPQHTIDRFLDLAGDEARDVRDAFTRPGW